MHVTARTAQDSFSLQILRAVPRESEHDLDWLNVKVEWRHGSARFEAISACLTLQEAVQLKAWLESLRDAPRDSVLSFTEPSLHCVSLLASDMVLFVLWLELTPDSGARIPVTLAFPRRVIRIDE